VTARRFSLFHRVSGSAGSAPPDNPAPTGTAAIFQPGAHDSMVKRRSRTRIDPRDGVFVALLRGVNVGGNNLISMRALKASFEKMGFTEVATYINSGNIIFRSEEPDGRKLEKRIEGVLSRHHQLGCKVVVRSLPEMAALIQNLPATWNGDTRWRYNVIFLRRAIDSRAVIDSLQPRPGIEQVAYHPGALLWSAEVKHLTRTSMLKLSAQKIYQDMTARNLNTTRKLFALMSKVAERSSP
jgi:uncharacterized protein (DUF1697 family)